MATFPFYLYTTHSNTDSTKHYSLLSISPILSHDFPSSLSLISTIQGFSFDPALRPLPEKTKLFSFILQGASNPATTPLHTILNIIPHFDPYETFPGSIQLLLYMKPLPLTAPLYFYSPIYDKETRIIVSDCPLDIYALDYRHAFPRLLYYVKTKTTSFACLYGACHPSSGDEKGLSIEKCRDSCLIPSKTVAPTPPQQDPTYVYVLLSLSVILVVFFVIIYLAE